MTIILKKYFAIIFLVIGLLYPNIGFGDNNILTSKKVLSIAEKTSDAMYFYKLNNGKFINCIEQTVLTPKESGDYWVVTFVLGKMCKVNYDDRLMLKVYINEQGKVIKVLPSREYFIDGDYCKNGNDCVSVLNNNEKKCLNFIYSFYGVIDNSEHCICLENHCIAGRAEQYK